MAGRPRLSRSMHILLQHGVCDVRTATSIPAYNTLYRRVNVDSTSSEISLFVKFQIPFFLLFFVSSPRLQVATVGRFSRSIRHTTRFRARKCFLGVSMTNFHIWPHFSPVWKFALRPMVTSNGNNSGIFKDRRKMFAPKWAFSGSGNLIPSSKFASDRPLLPW